MSYHKLGVFSVSVDPCLINWAFLLLSYGSNEVGNSTSFKIKSCLVVLFYITLIVAVFLSFKWSQLLFLINDMREPAVVAGGLAASLVMLQPHQFQGHFLINWKINLNPSFWYMRWIYRQSLIFSSITKNIF